MFGVRKQRAELWGAPLFWELVCVSRKKAGLAEGEGGSLQEEENQERVILWKPGKENISKRSRSAVSEAVKRTRELRHRAASRGPELTASGASVTSMEWLVLKSSCDKAEKLRVKELVLARTTLLVCACVCIRKGEMTVTMYYVAE